MDPSFIHLIRTESNAFLFMANSTYKESESHSVVSDSWRPRGLYSPGNSLSQNTGVGSLSLLQGIFPAQELNPNIAYA